MKYILWSLISVLSFALISCSNDVEDTISPSLENSPSLPVSQTDNQYNYSDSIKAWSENCTSNLNFGSREISSRDYINNLSDKTFAVHENKTYSYREGDQLSRNGPFATWYLEMFLEDISTHRPKKFESITLGDNTYIWADYIEYLNSVCNVYQGNAPIRSSILAHSKFMHWRTDWGGSATKWEPFKYIETGREIIRPKSPTGLEHYTKYIAGSGVMIVGGDKVPEDGMLAAYDRIMYMMSARPEFHDILKANEVRISLFGPDGDTSELPEFKDTDEPGGFSMGMTDAAMTANVEWLCYPGNPDAGGDPVLHEMVHTLNHIVFEQINETYFYERIYDLAISAIEKGIFSTNYEQNLEEGQVQGMREYVGEYWAMTVEGYLMDEKGYKNSHDTRDWIKENDPELYDLIIRYFPTKEWDLCSGS